MNLISGRRSLNSLMSDTESNIVIFNPETTTIKELMFKLTTNLTLVLLVCHNIKNVQIYCRGHENKYIMYKV